jgi:hypothetical protein
MNLARAMLLASVLLAACDSPDHAACLSACDAQNKCSGAKQTNCGGLCNAKPPDCSSEYTAYWTCAGSHLSEVCSPLTGTCADQFGKWSSCVTAFCLVNPLDSNCYY